MSSAFSAVPPAPDPFDNTVRYTRDELSSPAGFDGRDALPVGTRLAEFEVLCVLGTGGFGIVYLALDHALMRQVAIKEYMPSSLAVRGAGSWVALRAPQHAGTFAAGLRSFVNEAQLLASFDHPSLLKVHRFWEDFGTAYMVMQYYPGRTLKQELAAIDAAPSEAWLRATAEAILDALEVLHREGVYHRDVSPDNILLQIDGPPVLLDFGAARRVIGDRTQTLTAILKPSFAPVEQYADVTGMRQGPWTDVYALAAVLYYMIEGHPPVPAVARAVRDSQRPLTSEPGGLSTDLLAAIDWALAVAPEDRPQNAVQMRDALNGRCRRPAPRVRQETVLKPAKQPAFAPLSAGIAAGLIAVSLTSWAHHVSTLDRVTPSSAAAPAIAAATALTAVPISATPAEPPLPVAATPPSPAAAKPLSLAAAKSSSPLAAKSPATVTARQAAASARTALVPKAPAPRSPDEACQDLGFFRKAICIARECGSPRFAQHPQCTAQRQNDARLRDRGG